MWLWVHGKILFRICVKIEIKERKLFLLTICDSNFSMGGSSAPSPPPPPHPPLKENPVYGYFQDREMSRRISIHLDIHTIYTNWLII